MAKIEKVITGTVDVIITETYVDEDAAVNADAVPETTDVKVADLKIDNTKWRKNNE